MSIPIRQYLIFLIFSVLLTLTVAAQDQSIAERLGYPREAKLLIIHADDLGVSNSENTASIYALENTAVNSASIMVPCPWFPQIASYAREHKKMDFGVHLTLNSEWKHYKWGPVSSTEQVKSLVNQKGYFFSSVDSLVSSADPKEVEVELRNQVKMALDTGIDVTHLDTHMGSAASTPEIGLVYIRLGNEFKVPVLLDRRIMETPFPGLDTLITKNTVIVDKIHMAYPNNWEEGLDIYYKRLFKNLSSGLNCLLIHPAFNNAEMKAITIDHPEYGSAWRQEDFDFFTTPEYTQILQDEGVILVTWKELRDKITRSE